MNQYKEVSGGASPAELAKYARGIHQMDQLADRLHSQGRLPERFAGTPSQLPPFLEGKVCQGTITIGGKTGSDLTRELIQAGINVGSYARSMMENPDFTTLPNPEQIDLVRLHVRDLGIKKDYPTTNEIYQRVQDLGLELCPAEVGPQYRLQYKNQPRRERFAIGMKPITDSGGDPSVFALAHNDDGLWLDDGWTEPDYEWNPEDGFVFRLRKSS